MKRFHVHVTVDDLAANIRFYSTAFGMSPTVQKPDYAKWMMDDPRINFAISTHGATQGVNHLGMQVETEDELAALRAQVASAGDIALDQTNTACCYARSDKYWTTDPQGIAWETFRTLESIPVFGETSGTAAETKAGACCAVPTPDASQPAKSGACCA